MSLKVDTVFVSINARNFAAQTAWWTTILDRRHDREPMPSCHEWDLAKGVLFQVLDQPDGPSTSVSLRLKKLDKEIRRLRKAGIKVPDPAPVSGFKSLRWAAFNDPEGNPINLLEGK